MEGSASFHLSWPLHGGGGQPLGGVLGLRTPMLKSCLSVRLWEGCYGPLSPGRGCCLDSPKTSHSLEESACSEPRRLLTGRSWAVRNSDSGSSCVPVIRDEYLGLLSAQKGNVRLVWH